MTLPENCIKGIPNDQFLTPEGGVYTNVFEFATGHRSDGWMESSVNWQDDEHALAFTLAQTRSDGALQFRAGAAILSRYEIDSLIARPNIGNRVSYERQTLPENSYHGNILLSANTSKPTMNMIRALLAIACVRHSAD